MIIIVNIIVNGLMNIAVDLNLRKACNIINKKEVSKFIFTKKSKRFQSRNWENLMPGDIIKIKENEEFPADVLILDVVSNTDHTCYVFGS